MTEVIRLGLFFNTASVCLCTFCVHICVHSTDRMCVQMRGCVHECVLGLGLFVIEFRQKAPWRAFGSLLAKNHVIQQTNVFILQ